MTTKRRRQIKALARLAPDAASSVASAALAAGGNPLAALSFMGRTLGFLRRSILAVQDEREAEMLEIFSAEMGANYSDRGFAALMKTKFEERPWFRELAYHLAVEYAHRFTPEVGPAIAALMREYDRADKEVDYFFRGMLRLLTSISAAEYAALRQMVRALDDDFSRPGTEPAAFRLDGRADGAYVLTRFAEKGPGWEVNGLSSPHLRRLLRLLSDNELLLGEDARGLNPGPQFEFPSGELPRIRRLVAPSDT
ncbi:MAG: hypothetical protein ACYC8T_34635 [Myxococcaceae bacterium]